MYWFIDDDPDNREQFERLLPGCQTFEGPYEAMTEGQGSPNIIVIDISACGTIMETHSAYAPICSLIDRFPGATILVATELTIGHARDVVADVKRTMPGADIRAIGMWRDVDELTQLAAQPQERSDE